ncbi:MAG: hypothetical protein Q8N51_18825 [Gammaproteobacteria bacterium]|nr:hypothetical protein [Gammaproteobacteria bacterium]
MKKIVNREPIPPGADYFRVVVQFEDFGAGPAVVYDLGHLEDGGIHLNVAVPTQASDAEVVALRDAD